MATPNATTTTRKPLSLELWERALDSWRAWCARHEKLMHRLPAIRALAAWLSLLFMALACWVVPGYARGIVAVLASLAAVVAYVVLARTHTLRLGTVMTMFALAIPWAFGVAVATTTIAQALRMDTEWAGATVALASFVEEPGKLLPLVIVATVAPGRVRRFAAADWAVLGFAAGAAFTAAEDFARRAARRPGLLDLLLPDHGSSYGMNPWSSGAMTSMDGLAFYPGHQISAANTAMAAGLGIILWRTRRPGLRAVATLPAAVTLLLSLADHAAYNACVGSTWPANRIEGFPLILEWAWAIGGHGRGAIALNVVLLFTCLAVDASRRRAAGDAGKVFGDSRSPAEPRLLESVPSPVRGPVAAAWLTVWYTVSDAAATLTALSRVPGRPRRDAVRSGRVVRIAVLAARADAMTATTPGQEPMSRRRFWLLSMATSTLVTAVVVGWGTMIARAIGRSLVAAGDSPPYFAGLLSSLGSWWDSLGFGGQALVTAGIVVVIIASGGSLALALGLSGIATWTSDHGDGLASLLRDPRNTIHRYLTRATPGDAIWDTLDFLMTFVPGSVLGKTVGSTLRMLPDEVLARVVAWRQGRLAERLIVESAPNAAGAARLNSLLRTAELANPLLDSLRTTGKLPNHYITKSQAKAAGWAKGKPVGTTSPGGQIGGDVYQNDDLLLPPKDGRSWQEADVGLQDTISRSKQSGTRLVYSNDGLVYVSDDHYQTFYRLPNWR